MDFSKVLAALSDGEFHSGEELGAALGVSRTAIWKQLQRLTELGLTVESVKGRGYRLAGGFSPLSGDSIRSGLNGAAAGSLADIIVKQQLTSTSTVLAEMARTGAAAGTVCVAEQQTAGRGRLGRQWVSPYGRNLMFSVLWEFEGGAAALEGLSLAVGLTLAEALDSLGLAGVGLKWPNDVLCDGKKLAGVLLEMQGDAAGLCQVIIGVGVNVALPDDAPIDQAWTDLSREGLKNCDRNALLAAILNSLLPMLQRFGDTGFEVFRDDWQRFDALEGQSVELRTGDSVRAGVCRGVASNGALRFEGAAGVELISGGEVSVRRATTREAK